MFVKVLLYIIGFSIVPWLTGGHIILAYCNRFSYKYDQQRKGNQKQRERYS